MESAKAEVQHNEAAHRFEVESDGHLAVAEYVRSGSQLILTHTEVPEALEGQGIGSQLARTALTYARDNDLQVVPRCSFMAAYIRRHPEYQALVSGSNQI
jgi:uncharacterized protein